MGRVFMSVFIAIIFSVFGYILFWSTGQTRRAIDRVESLSVVSYEALAKKLPAEGILVSGKLAGKGRSVLADMICYERFKHRKHYSRHSSTPSMEHEAARSVKPALAVLVDGRECLVDNGYYIVKGDAEYVDDRSDEFFYFRHDGLTGEAPVGIQGAAALDAVTGKIVFTKAMLIAGDASSFSAYYRGQRAPVLYASMGCFSVAGLIILFGLVPVIVRSLKRT